ncbi:MAG: DUF2254 domain-containing protein [Janthinobacterium lividum]
MRAVLSRWLETIRTGFWFVPMVMLAASAALALLLLHLDRQLDPGTKSIMDWAYSGGPEGARSLLSTIAGSMITAASVTFSLASVALSIASQQYGSRVLRNFMRDRITQVLLGTFVATFIYSVLVVRTIRGSDFSGGFVPAISVTVAIALSLASLVLLIYFIHHVSASIQASRIIRVIAEDVEAAIPKLYPSETGEALDDAAAAEATKRRGTLTLFAEMSGYLQTVDLDTLMEEAERNDSIIKVLLKPGDHVLTGSPIAEVWGTASLPSEEKKKLIGYFYVDRERTPAQDIRYQFQQLTDVIVRALSPGINDPFTAINGIDELAAAMLLFAQRPEITDRRQDDKGALRLIVQSASAAELLRATVGHIAIYASSDYFVMDRLRRVLMSVRPILTSSNDVAEVDALAAELTTLQRKDAE